MTFNEAVKTCFSKYFTFSGRAARPENCYFFLFRLFWSAIATVIDRHFFGRITPVQTEGSILATATSSRSVQSIVSPNVFVPHVAAWQRMPDTGRSGLYALLPILLILGAFAVLIFGVGFASSFQHRGGLDILFTRATLLIEIPTLLVLIGSPLLVLWWLSRPNQPDTNKYGPNPYEVAQ